MKRTVAWGFICVLNMQQEFVHFCRRLSDEIHISSDMIHCGSCYAVEHGSPAFGKRPRGVGTHRCAQSFGKKGALDGSSAPAASLGLLAHIRIMNGTMRHGRHRCPHAEIRDQVKFLRIEQLEQAALPVNELVAAQLTQLLDDDGEKPAQVHARRSAGETPRVAATNTSSRLGRAASTRASMPAVRRFATMRDCTSALSSPSTRKLAPSALSPRRVAPVRARWQRAAVFRRAVLRLAESLSGGIRQSGTPAQTRRAW